MKCPICSSILVSTKDDHYQCNYCQFAGTFENITEFKGIIREADCIITDGKEEIDDLTENRRRAITDGDPTYLLDENIEDQNLKLRSLHRQFLNKKNRFQKCPRCNEKMTLTEKDQYLCLKCLFSGTFKEVIVLKDLLTKTDTTLEMKKVELEKS